MGERIKQALDAIAPGEHRVLERRFEPVPGDPSWYQVGTVGEVPNGLFFWRDMPDRASLPRSETFFHRYRSVRDVPRPVCEFTGAPDQLCDLYPGGDFFFLSERAFAILQALDPNALEWVEAEVIGTSIKYYLCLCRQSIDAIDDDRSTIIVSYKEIYRGSHNYLKWVTPANGLYSIDEFACSGAHVLINYYNTEVLFSKAAIDALAEGRCRNLYFWPTDSNESSQQIRLY